MKYMEIQHSDVVRLIVVRQVHNRSK